MGGKGALGWIGIVIMILLAIFGIQFGTNILIMLSQNAVNILGLFSGLVGLYLVTTKKSERKIFGIDEGYFLVILGCLMVIGGIFFEVLHSIISNTILMLIMLILLIIYLGKRAGWIE